MEIPTYFERCTICLEKKPLTREHIIPESVGGTLEADLQCKCCNSDLGSSVVSQARKDPAIRLAIRSLRDQLPHLYTTMEEGQLYTTVGDDGQTVSAKLRNGRLQTRTQKMENGTFIFDPKTGQETIQSVLQNRGLGLEEIKTTIERFKDSPIGQLVSLSAEISAVKREIKSAFPQFGFPEMDERVPVLIAYNYLCLLLGVQVFDKRLDFIRRRIIGDEPSDRLKVEGLTSREYRPFHQVYSEPNENGILVKISLFGWLVYYVHFRDVIYGGPYVVYVEDLGEGRSLLAFSVEEAEKGIFHSTKVRPPQEKPKT
ncbi:MAG: HNH endonuclease [Bacteroidota bacterium]